MFVVQILLCSDKVHVLVYRNIKKLQAVNYLFLHVAVLNIPTGVIITTHLIQSLNSNSLTISFLKTLFYKCMNQSCLET